MSFINRLANGNLLDNLTINNRLYVGEVVNTKNIVILEKITLLPDAEIEGYFLKTFSEPLDEDTNEDIDLYEKIARIGTKISTNTLQNGNNAAAISTRYTKGQTDALFAKNTKKVSNNYRSKLLQFIMYDENSDISEVISLQGLLSEKANLNEIYTKDDVDAKLIDPRFETTNDTSLTFYGFENTTLKALF